MWTRKYVKAFTKYGIRNDDQIQLRSTVTGVNFLIKVLNTGAVEVSMNGTAIFDSPEEFYKFWKSAAEEVVDAKADLDKHLIV